MRLLASEESFSYCVCPQEGTEALSKCMSRAYHGTAIAHVDGVGSDRWLGALLRIPTVDLEILDTLALQQSG
jgi:hypothetical protein